MQIASAMVACTFISAPLMFVSAKMITLSKTDPSKYIEQLNAFTFDISIAAVVASIWVVFVFTITKKLHRLPHNVTTCLIFSQVGMNMKNIFIKLLTLKIIWNKKLIIIHSS